jgi:hypothetical protein
MGRRLFSVAARIVVYLVLTFWVFLVAAWLGAWDQYDCPSGGVSDCTPPVHPHAYVLTPIAIVTAMLAVIVCVELWLRRSRTIGQSNNDESTDLRPL